MLLDRDRKCSKRSKEGDESSLLPYLKCEWCFSVWMGEAEKGGPVGRRAWKRLRGGKQEHMSDSVCSSMICYA